MASSSLVFSKNEVRGSRTESEGGFFLKCSSCFSLNVNENSFSSLTTGRVLFLDSSYQAIEIKSNNFTDIIGYASGGAIFSSTDDVSILDNHFLDIHHYNYNDTSLTKQGAAISIRSSTADNILISGNTFARCRATIGGAISFTHYRP